eukprot:s150_g2.t2
MPVPSGLKGPQANEDDSAKDAAAFANVDMLADFAGPEAEVQLIQRFEAMLARRDEELFRRLDRAVRSFVATPDALTHEHSPLAHHGDDNVNAPIRSKALVESRVRALAAKTRQLEVDLDIFSENNETNESNEPEEEASRSRRRSTRSTTRFGRCQHYLVKHVVGTFWFESFFMVGILFHALVLGVQIDLATWDNPDTDAVMILDGLQHLFAVTFTAELAVRWMAEGRYFLWRSPNVVWNWLDTFLVVTSLVEISGEISVAISGGSQAAADLSSIGNMRVIRIVRISRLLRVLRIVRVLRFVRSLRNLVSSIAMTFRSLAWSVILLVIIIYMFGVLLTDGVTEFLNNEEGIDTMLERDLRMYFGSVHGAMHTLFRSIANGISWDVVVRPLVKASWFWGYVYSLYIVFTLFAVLNVITAVFCQSTLEGAARDKELLAESHMLNKERYYLLVEDLFKNLQSDESGKVTLEDFQDHFNDVEVRAFFHGLDLEPSDAWVLFSLLDDDGSGDIDAEEFVEGLLRLKGPARAIDLAAIGRDCKSCVKRVHQTAKQMKRLEGLLSSLLRIYASGQAADDLAPVAATGFGARSFERRTGSKTSPFRSRICLDVNLGRVSEGAGHEGGGGRPRQPDPPGDAARVARGLVPGHPAEIDGMGARRGSSSDIGAIVAWKDRGKDKAKQPDKKRDEDIRDFGQSSASSQDLREQVRVWLNERLENTGGHELSDEIQDSFGVRPGKFRALFNQTLQQYCNAFISGGSEAAWPSKAADEQFSSRFPKYRPNGPWPILPRNQAKLILSFFQAGDRDMRAQRAARFQTHLNERAPVPMVSFNDAEGGGIDGGPIIGELTGMCSRDEAREREMTRQLDKFEWKKGTDPKNPEVDLKLATKKYQRSSADKAYRSQDVRSLDACWKTMEYLMTEILDFDSNPKPGFAVQAIPYIEVYSYLRDRTRSIRVDLHLQQPRSTTQRVFVETHECCLRFEMLSLYLLLGRGQNQEKATEKYDTKLGLKAISQTIEPLLNAYQALHEKQVAKSILAEAMGGFGLADEDDDEDYYSPYEMAARRYIVLLLMSFAPDELSSHLSKMSRELLMHPLVSFATQVYAAFHTEDYARFLRFYRETDFLSAVAMSGVADLARLRALWLLVRTYPQQVGDRISLAKLKNILAFVSDDHAKTFLAFHGLQIVIDKESDGGAHVVLPKKGSPEANALPLLQGPARLPEKCEFPKGADSLLVAKFEALGLSRADIAIGHADPIAEVTLVAAEAPQDAGGDVVAEEMMAEEEEPPKEAAESSEMVPPTSEAPPSLTVAQLAVWGPRELDYAVHDMAVRSSADSSQMLIACSSFIPEAANFVEVVAIGIEGQTDVRSTTRLPHYYPPTRVRWLGGGSSRELLASSGDCLRVWKADGELCRLLRHESNPQGRCTPITSVDSSESPNSTASTGAQMASCDVYGICALWDVEMGSMQQAFDLGQPLTDVAFGPNRLLAATGEKGDCFLMDPRQSQEVAAFAPSEHVAGPARIAWGVKSLLAVASGKGGVGKSSVCVNLAYTMQSLGLKVGILDADIYGPSLPAMIPPDAIEKVYASESGGIIPLQYEGAPLMSAGFLRPGDFAAVRGPMASAMVQQMLTTTEWGALDVLLVDMPPGTGDIHLTVAQQAKVDAAIVVCQFGNAVQAEARYDIAMYAVRASLPRAVAHVRPGDFGQFYRGSLLNHGYKAHLEQHFRGQVKIPTVAIVENMSFFVCCFVEKGLPYVLAASESGSMDEFRRLASGAMAALEELRTRFQPGLRLEVLLECRSAKMRDEFTGKRLFREEDIPQNVVATKVSTAGRYAVNIDWSNSHKSLFSFDLLAQAHRPDMLAVSWQGEGGLTLYDVARQRKAAPRCIKSPQPSTIASLQWSYAFPELLACAREAGDVEVWHFPEEGVEMAAAASAPAYTWAPRGRAANCSALAMSPEVRPGSHALVLATMPPGQPGPQGQEATTSGGSLWVVALPQPTRRPARLSPGDLLQSGPSMAQCSALPLAFEKRKKLSCLPRFEGPWARRLRPRSWQARGLTDVLPMAVDPRQPARLKRPAAALRSGAAGSPRTRGIKRDLEQSGNGLRIAENGHFSTKGQLKGIFVPATIMPIKPVSAHLANIKAVLINLDRRPDRLAECSKRLETHCPWLQYNRMRASDGKIDTITSEDWEVSNSWHTGRNVVYQKIRSRRKGWDDLHTYVIRELPMSAGERGCASSHIRAWRHCIDVFEDDAVPTQEFTEGLSRALASLPSDADVLYLGYSQAAEWRRHAEYVWTTVAYMVWPEGAHKLLSKLPVNQPVDNFMATLCADGDIKAYCMRPKIVHQADGWNVKSDVGHSDEAPPPGAVKSDVFHTDDKYWGAGPANPHFNVSFSFGADSDIVKSDDRYWE